MSGRKEYLVQVTVIEGRYLKGLDSGGTSDPYIKITCGNLEPQVTVPKEKTNTAVWNQSFTFRSLLMNEYELETWELLFEVYDRNTFLTDAFMGLCSIGLGTMYRHTQHEFFRCWLSIFNEEKPKEPQGYLMVSCYIIGPGDKAPMHAEGDTGIGDIDCRMGMIPIEDMSSEEQRAKMLKDKNIHTVDKPDAMNRAYQLSINLYKAEGLPPNSSAFVAVRCSGVVLKTPIVENTESPSFQTTLLFPVYSPFLNDNVSIKVWNHFFARANQCIAQVCEEYGPASDFNLNTLLKVGQVIGTRWYNLYSVREDHRDIYGNRTREGKEYVGRILMRVSLLPIDNPQLRVARSTVGHEPMAVNYVLLVDVFDIHNATGLYEKVWVQASIGGKMTPRSAYPKFLKGQHAYTWETPEQQKIQEIDEYFPVQSDQCPDIFLYLWHEQPGFIKNSTRLAGYARIKAKDCMKEKPETRWITIKPTKPNADSPGELLTTIHFAPKGCEAVRGPTDFDKAVYDLSVRIKSGFYLAPNVEKDEDLETFLEVFVGKKKLKQSSIVKGRYPNWNFEYDGKIKLNSDLRYEGDLVVIVYRMVKGMMGTKKEMVGQFVLKLLNIRATRIKLNEQGIDTNYFREYFNIVKDSTVNGRVLAFFTLEKSKNEDDKEDSDEDKAEDKKEEDGKNDFEDNKEDNQGKKEYGLTEGNLQRLNMEQTDVTVTITALGLRNLTKSAKKPVLTFSITNDSEMKKHEIRANKELAETQGSTDNPYILNTVKFDAKVADKVIDWPFLQISLTDEGWFGCKNAYTTLLLFPYATFLSEVDKKRTLNVFNTNVEVTKTRTRAGTTKKGSSLGSGLSGRKLTTISGSHRNSKSSRSGISSLGSLSVISDKGDAEDEQLQKISEGAENEEDMEIIKEDEEEAEIKLSRVSSPKPVSERNVATNRRAAEDEMNLAADQTEEEKALIDDIYKMHFEEFDIIQCTKADKQKISDEAGERIKHISRLKQEFINLKGGTANKLKRDKLIKEFTKRIEKLKSKGIVNPEEFCGFDRNLEEEDDTAAYHNREVIREEYETTMDLPYSRVELYSSPTFGYKDSCIKSPFKQEKQELVGVLKCKITVEKKENADKASTERSQERRDRAKNADAEEDKPHDKFTAVDETNHMFPFNLHKDEFLNYAYEAREFKIRAYIIQCHNLSAVDSYADFKSAVAGYSAQCSANPYLELQIGAGKNSNGLTKFVKDSKNYMSSTLNPKFKGTYPMDLNLPEDNALKITVKSKGTVLDSVIGGTEIDLEDRYYGDAYNKAIMSLNIYREYYKEKIKKEEQAAEKKPPEYKKRLKHKLEEISRLRTQIENFEHLRKIEFRQLMKEGKLQPQGTIQMWLDIFPAEERFPEYNLNSSQQNKYELRLVIWSIYNVPKAKDKTVVDGYVGVTFESSDWSKDAIKKITDTHYGSKDGHCVFNYRMKFPFELPGEPRLKIQVFDFNTVGSNEIIGACSILLKPYFAINYVCRLCRKLAKEGKCETDVVRLYLTHPNHPKEGRGEIEIQMSLVTKEEAENQPVGEAQEEPNEKPRLVKPTEGRGLGAYLKGSFVDASKWRLPSFGLFTLLKYGMLMGGGVAAMAGLLVMTKFI